MRMTYKNLTIRNAVPADAEQLAAWWNDGAVMAHAGFPYGTGEKAEVIAERLKKDTDETGRRLMIECDGRLIGEMNYVREDIRTAGIGIKICDFSLHDRGLGKVLLSMLIVHLFQELGYRKIILDTNLDNKRAQHVYERLGFRKLRVRENAWKNQLGEYQSAVDYVLYPEDFVNFAK